MVNSVDSTFGFVVFIAPNEKDLRIMASKSNDRPHSASLDWNPGLGIIEEGAITSEIRNVITTSKY